MAEYFVINSELENGVVSTFNDELFREYGVAQTIHYYDSSNQNIIYQNLNRFTYRLNGIVGQVRLADNGKVRLSRLSRLATRLLRTDKGSCVWFEGSTKLVIFYQFKVYAVDLVTGQCNAAMSLPFRNPLYSGVLSMSDGRIYFGEYVGNWELRSIRIYRSLDFGNTWGVVYAFPPQSIFHVHSIKWDPYEQKIWIFTGDFDGQCRVCVTDPEFKDIEVLGDGGQQWRAVSAFFLKDRVVWGMDSPLQQVTVNTLDRQSRSLKVGQLLEGPVWFGRQLSCGGAVLQTTVEHSSSLGVQSRDSVLYYTKDYNDWSRVSSWKKDIYANKYFRHGLVSFSDGPQSLSGLIVNGEALVGFDGTARQLLFSDFVE